VEKFNPYAGKFGQRQDMFGIIDIVSLCPIRGIIGVQSCGNSFSEHWRKLTEEKADITHEWLSCGGKLYIYSWRKVKKRRGGKQMIWHPRIKEITLEDVDCENSACIKSRIRENYNVSRG
jgi:hypothetical protein